MMSRTPRTHRSDCRSLSEMVGDLMSGRSSSFALRAQDYLGRDDDARAQDLVESISRQLSRSRWWHDFVDSTNPKLVEDVQQDWRLDLVVEDKSKLRSALQKLKGLLNNKRRAVEANHLLFAHKVSKYTRPDDPAFHFGRLGSDLIGDLALAEQLCDAVGGVKDPLVVENVYGFLSEQAPLLFAGVKVNSVLADHIQAVTHGGA